MQFFVVVFKDNAFFDAALRNVDVEFFKYNLLLFSPVLVAIFSLFSTPYDDDTNLFDSVTEVTVVGCSAALACLFSYHSDALRRSLWQ